MKKTLIAVVLIVSVLCSMLTFNLLAREDASTGIYVSGFSFLDGSGGEINTPSGKMRARIIAENLNSDPVDYAFSLAAYNNGELIDMQTSYGKAEVGLGVDEFTPFIEVDTENCDEVHAFLTTDDFSTLLAPMAVMGSAENEITYIYVGDERIELEEGETEYSLKRFLTADKFPVEIRVGRKELGQKVTVDELTESKQTVNIVSLANNGENPIEYKLDLELYEVNEASLTALSAGGSPVEGFDPKTKEYIVKTLPGSTAVPVVTATAYDKNASVNISPATELPGNTTVTVTSGGKTETYTVKFTKAVQGTFDSWASHRGKGQIENIATEGGEDYITLCSYGVIDSGKPTGDSRINYYAFTLPETEGSAVSAELTMKFKYNSGGNYVYYQYNADDMATYNVRSYPVWKGFNNKDESLRLGEYHDSSSGIGTIMLDGTKMRFASMGDGNMRTIILAEKLYEGAAVITYLFNPTLTVHFVKEGE